MLKKKEAQVYLFLFCAIFVILYHVFGYFGHFGYDDMTYARIAKNWIDGQLIFDNAFSYRFTIISSTALSYLILGVNDLASALPPMLVSISILFIVYYLLKREGTMQTILGLTLTLSINAFLFYTDKLMPDIYVALFLILTLFFYNTNRFITKGKPILYGFLFSLSLFLAFGSKETTVLFLPLMIFLFITDLIRKQNAKFWISATISGIVITVAYLTVIWLLTGDLFTRFEVLASNNQSQTFAYSYDKLPVSQILKRISYDLFVAYMNEGLLLPFVLIIAGFKAQGIRSLITINDTRSLFTVSTLILLLSANFMSVSPFSYHPVPTEIRHSLFIIPFAAIAASYVLRDFLTEKKNRFLITSFFLIISIASMFTDRQAAFSLYIPLTVLLVAYTFLKTTRLTRIVLTSMIICVLLLKPMLFFYNSAANVNYRLQKKVVFNYFINPGEPCYVFTDPVQKNFGDYYNGFDTTAMCRFVNYTKPDQCSFEPTHRKYLFLNWHTQFFSQTWDKLPYLARNIDSTYTLLYENPKHHIYVYEMQHVIIPEIDGNKVLETKNDFESNHLFWQPELSELPAWIEKSGNRVIKLNEYSPGFSASLDTLLDTTTSNLFVRCRVKVNFHSDPSAQLAVSVEDEHGVYFSENKVFSSIVTVKHHWQTVEFDMTINGKNMKPRSIIKICIWNPDRNHAYLDDFEIIFYKIFMQ